MMMKSNDMEKLSSSVLRTEYWGLTMPVEFMELCKKYPGLESVTKTRPSNPHRFYTTIERFLKRNLGIKSLYQFTANKYPGYISDLYSPSMTEIGYRNMYPEIYDEFESLDWEDKKKVFNSSDHGARSLYELKQDVYASIIFEDIVASYSFNTLKPGPLASGRFSENVTTYCDFEYDATSKLGNRVVVPVELKTKWKKDFTVRIRGSVNKIKEQEGIILVVYPYENKYVLIDSTDPNVKFRHTTYKDKSYDITEIKESDLVDLEFWNERSMKDMLNAIYTLYKKRGQ